MKNKDIKVALIQRICPNYRVPVFSLLSDQFSFCLFYGKGGKTGSSRNAKPVSGFNALRLFTLSFGFHSSSRSFYLSFFPTLIFHLSKMRPDVIITEGITNILNNVISVLFARVTNTPLIWWDAGRNSTLKESSFRKLIGPFALFLMRQAQAYIVYGRMGSDYFHSKGISQKKIFIAQNTSAFLPVRDAAEPQSARFRNIKAKLTHSGKQVVLYVGALEKRRCLRELVIAFEKIRVTAPNLVLLIVGDGPERGRLQKLVSDKQIDDVHFLGRIEKNTCDYFSLCDVVVLPGWSSLVVNQAMASAKPVITVPYGGVEYELIEDKKSGFLVERGNIDSLCSVLLQVLSDETLRKTIGESALQKYIKDATIEKMVSQIAAAVLSVYKNTRLRKNG